MASNYWVSTQRLYWTFSADKLAEIRGRLDGEDRALVQQYPLPDKRHVNQFFNQQLVKLGKRMQVRQQVIATAQVYIRRFYIKVPIRHTNPYIIVATALYLACKTEESPQHIRVVVQEARAVWQEYMPADISKLGEFEFYLISEMNSQLIVHHPYRTLQELQTTLNLTQDDVSFAWSVINDSYITDLPLMYPPHVIAVTAIFFTLTLKPTQAGLQAAASTTAALTNLPQLMRDSSIAEAGASTSAPNKLLNFAGWLAEGEVDIKAVIDCSQELISLYEVLEAYDEKICKMQISAFVKGRGLI